MGRIKFKKAFTLAEILIVLTIIGVMAVMTIPSLMQNANEQQKITLLKKGYNAVVNAYATEFATKTPPSYFNEGGEWMGGWRVWQALDNQLNVKYYAPWARWDYSTVTKNFTKPTPSESLHPADTWIITEDGIGYTVDAYKPNSKNPKKLDFMKDATSTEKALNDLAGIHIVVDIDGPFKGPNKRCGGDDLGITDKDDLKNLAKCDTFILFITQEGITAGNPDTMITAKIIAGD